MMFYRVRSTIQRALHNHQIRGVLHTPPIQSTRDSLIFLSQVCHDDLYMYLIALKSIFSKIKRGRILILNDGSLTQSDLLILNEHLSSPQIIHIDDIDNKHLPKRGCWERLLTCIECSKTDFVIQVDSDLIAISSLDDVCSAIDENVAFTLGTRFGTEIVPALKAADFARSLKGDHVQLAAERNFSTLKNASSLKYVRGSAGFAGFPRQGLSHEFLQDFSNSMVARLGARWAEWGTEQVASNFMIANNAGAIVLPEGKYTNFIPPMDVSAKSLIHFFGTHRFSNGEYTRLSRNFVVDALA